MLLLDSELISEGCPIFGPGSIILSWCIKGY